MKKIRNIAARAERIKKLENELKEFRKEALEKLGVLIFDSYKNNFDDIEVIKKKITETIEKYGLAGMEKSKQTKKPEKKVEKEKMPEVESGATADKKPVEPQEP